MFFQDLPPLEVGQVRRDNKLKAEKTINHDVLCVLQRWQIYTNIAPHFLVKQYPGRLFCKSQNP
jgi:hypothetical protein